MSPSGSFLTCLIPTYHPIKKHVINMDKEIFKKNINKTVKLTIEPNDFPLTGTIDDVFNECIEFRTRTKIGYLAFTKITSMMLLEDEHGYSNL
jgi:hypothetical protein